MVIKLALNLYILLLSFIMVESDDQDALLQIQANTSRLLILSSKNKECYDCQLIQLAQFSNVKNISIRIDTFRPSYYLFLQTRQKSQGEGQFCEEYFREPFEFGENGTYLLEINANQNETSFSCQITTIVEAESLYEPILIATGMFIGAAGIYILCKFLYIKYYHVLSATNSNRDIINSDLGSLLDENVNAINAELTKPSKTKSNRMKSVDVFRGLSLCIMIFVNYGSGGYSFLVI